MNNIRLRSPLYAQIELTFACNLACAHCYNEPRFSNSDGIVKLRTVKKERTSAERFVEIAEELARHDVFSITLTGGEPFTVRDRLYAALEALKRNGLHVGINSNLTLVNEDDARRLSEYGDVGIMTSIASHDAETHDKIMGKESSHERTLRNIRLIQEHDVLVSANMVVSKHNTHQVYDTGIFCHSLGMNHFQTGQAVPSSSGGQMHLDHALTLDQVLDYLEQMHKVRKETGMHVRLTNPLPYCSVWESHPHLRYLVESSTCTAGRSIIQVSPNGEVKPCPMIANSYGNILDEGLDVVWNRMTEWSEDKYVPETCKPCDLVKICRGACRAEAERIVGALESKHPYSVKPVKLEESEELSYDLKPGTRIRTEQGLKARRERDNVYVLFASNRYLVATEPVARFISAVKTKGGITVDQELARDREAINVISKGLDSGILLAA